MSRLKSCTPKGCTLIEHQSALKEHAALQFVCSLYFLRWHMLLKWSLFYVFDSRKLLPIIVGISKIMSRSNYFPPWSSLLLFFPKSFSYFNNYLALWLKNCLWLSYSHRRYTTTLYPLSPGSFSSSVHKNKLLESLQFLVSGGVFVCCLTCCVSPVFSSKTCS